MWKLEVNIFWLKWSLGLELRLDLVEEMCSQVGQDLMWWEKKQLPEVKDCPPQEVSVASLRFPKQNLHYNQRFSEIKCAFCHPSLSSPPHLLTQSWSPPDTALITFLTQRWSPPDTELISSWQSWSPPDTELITAWHWADYLWKPLTTWVGIWSRCLASSSE